MPVVARTIFHTRTICLVCAVRTISLLRYIFDCTIGITPALQVCIPACVICEIWLHILHRQHLHRLDHFERIANLAAERFVHIRNHTITRSASRFADINHDLCQRLCICFVLHKCAAATFHIQHDCIRTCRKLLAHNRRCNERQTVDCRRHIAQRIDLLICRCQISGLSDKRQLHRIDVFNKFCLRDTHTETRNRL